MKTTIYLSILLIFLISAGCKKEDSGSFLSESTPLNAMIYLTKKIDTSGTLINNISVCILGTKEGPLEIRDGWIKVNNIKMNFVKVKAEDGTIYNTYNADGLIDQIEASKQYNFEIKLSDGTIYNSSITTQETELNELNVPANQSRNEDMNISWKETHPTERRDVYFNAYSCDIFIYGWMDEANETERNSGEYFIPKENFKDRRLDKVTIKISSYKSGTLDPGLSGDFCSTFEIEKVCEIQ